MDGDDDALKKWTEAAANEAAQLLLKERHSCGTVLSSTHGASVALDLLVRAKKQAAGQRHLDGHGGAPAPAPRTLVHLLSLIPEEYAYLRAGLLVSAARVAVTGTLMLVTLTYRRRSRTVLYSTCHLPYDVLPCLQGSFFTSTSRSGAWNPARFTMKSHRIMVTLLACMASDADIARMCFNTEHNRLVAGAYSGSIDMENDRPLGHFMGATFLSSLGSCQCVMAPTSDDFKAGSLRNTILTSHGAAVVFYMLKVVQENGAAFTLDVETSFPEVRHVIHGDDLAGLGQDGVYSCTMKTGASVAASSVSAPAV
jgi:hypothetical protein